MIIWLTFDKNPPIHYLNKLEYFTRPIYFFCVNCGLLESMFIYCICTQYLVGAYFALITASIRRGMEVISLWHCWGGVKPRFLWQWPSAHLHFWSLVSHFPLDNTHRFSMFRSGEFAGQSSTQHHARLTNFWCFWQCGQVPNPAGKWNQHL